MPVSLSDFTIGETGYVAKMNANNLALRDYLDQRETAQANVATSALSVSAMQSVLFGTTPAMFGQNSYRTQAIGSDLIITAGSAWAPSQQLVTQLVTGATVSMTGQPAGTYYLNAVNGDPLTQPVISTIARDPLWSFTWNGSSTSNLVRLASVIQPLLRGAETVTFSGSLLLDWQRSDTLRVTLTGNATIALTGAYDGQRCMLEVLQDATGGRTLTASSAVRIGTDVAWDISSAPNTLTRVGLIYHAPSSRYDLVAVARGFGPF